MTDSEAAAIEESVSETLAQFREHNSNADWDAVGAFYSDSPDFRFYENGVLRYGSAEDVRAALSGLTPDTKIETVYENTVIQALSPERALLSTNFESAFSDSTGVLFSFSGAVTIVWAKEPQGWRIFHGHSSAPIARTY